MARFEHAFVLHIHYIQSNKSGGDWHTRWAKHQIWIGANLHFGENNTLFQYDHSDWVSFVYPHSLPLFNIQPKNDPNTGKHSIYIWWPSWDFIPVNFVTRSQWRHHFASLNAIAHIAIIKYLMRKKNGVLEATKKRHLLLKCFWKKSWVE